MTTRPANFRIDEGLLKQFDAWAKAKGMSRNKAVTVCMRQALNGGQLKPIIPAKRVIGFHPITSEPIYEGER